MDVGYRSSREIYRKYDTTHSWTRFCKWTAMREVYLTLQTTMDTTRLEILHKHQQWRSISTLRPSKPANAGVTKRPIPLNLPRVKIRTIPSTDFSKKCDELAPFRTPFMTVFNFRTLFVTIYIFRQFGTWRGSQLFRIAFMFLDIESQTLSSLQNYINLHKTSFLIMKFLEFVTALATDDKYDITNTL